MTESATTGRKGFFVLFGRPGVGKTTAALQAFQDSLYIASATSLEAFYANWLKTPAGITSGKRMPKKIYVLDQYSRDGSPVVVDAKRHMVRVPQRATFESIVEEVTIALSEDKAAGRPPRYRNVIIDEVTTFWDRFFIEIVRDMSAGDKGNKDGRAHHGALQVWTREVLDRFRTVLSMGANLVGIAHDVEPDGVKRGGPQLPNQRATRIFGADSHMCLHRDTEGGDAGGLGVGDDTKIVYIWKAYASKDWVSKARGISNERLAEIRTWELEAIAREGGFEP